MWCRRSIRSWVQTAVGGSNARNTRVCKGLQARGLGPVDRVGLQNARVLCNSNQEDMEHLCGLRSIIFKIPRELGGWPGTPGVQEKSLPFRFTLQPQHG